MSRIGKKPVVIPAGVQVTVNGSNVTVKGPKGELSASFDPAMTIAVEGNELIVTRPSDVKEHIPALNAGTVGIMVPVSVLFTIAVARILYRKGVL